MPSLSQAAMPSRCSCCLSAPLPAAYLVTDHSCSPARRCMWTRRVRVGWLWLAWEMPNRWTTVGGQFVWGGRTNSSSSSSMISSRTRSDSTAKERVCMQHAVRLELMISGCDMTAGAQHDFPPSPPGQRKHSPSACCCGSPSPSKLPLRLFLLLGRWW